MLELPIITIYHVSFFKRINCTYKGAELGYLEEFGYNTLYEYVLLMNGE
jgi:hypothetical protein